MKSNNSQTLWTNLTETQSEAVNGGQVAFNSAFFSKLTDQSNVAAIIAAALLGIAVSALFGLEIKRAFLIGGIFMLVHIGFGIGFWLLFGP